MNIISVLMLKVFKGTIKKLVNECFYYLKKEAALTTNNWDDKTMAYAHKAVIDFIDTTL